MVEYGACVMIMSDFITILLRNYCRHISESLCRYARMTIVGLNIIIATWTIFHATATFSTCLPNSHDLCKNGSVTWNEMNAWIRMTGNRYENRVLDIRICEWMCESMRVNVWGLSISYMFLMCELRFMVSYNVTACQLTHSICITYIHVYI